MTDAQSLFVSAFVVSIAFCAPPGGVTAEAVRRGLLWAYRPVVLFELGAFVGGSAWAMASLTGLATATESVPVRLLLAAVALIACGRRSVSATTLRWVNGLSALTLVYFSVRLLATLSG